MKATRISSNRAVHRKVSCQKCQRAWKRLCLPTETKTECPRCLTISGRIITEDHRLDDKPGQTTVTSREADWIISRLDGIAQAQKDNDKAICGRLRKIENNQLIGRVAGSVLVSTLVFFGWIHDHLDSIRVTIQEFVRTP